MPTIRKKKLKERISTPEQLTDDRIHYLFTGFCLTGDDPKFANDDEARRCWRINKKKLMEMWLCEWKRPGQRPWAWWRWEAPERRKKIGVEKWYDSEKWRFTFDYEDQVELLERLGLLERFELKQLPELKRMTMEYRKAMREMGNYFDLGELDPSIEVEEALFIDETMDGEEEKIKEAKA